MKTLYIDTHNTKKFDIGYFNKNNLTVASGQDTSLEILNKIDELTNNVIEKIIIIKGPGSLTGLRIGSCFAQGISLAKKIKTLGLSIWDLVFEEYKDIEVYFNTGTKMWLYKTKNEEKLEEMLQPPKNLWISNTPDLLDFEQKKCIKWPNMIHLMHKYHQKASLNIDLLYPVNLFQF